KVKLLNALPFAPADLRRDSLETAWRADRYARGGAGAGGVFGRGGRDDPPFVHPHGPRKVDGKHWAATGAGVTGQPGGGGGGGVAIDAGHGRAGRGRLRDSDSQEAPCQDT